MAFRDVFELGIVFELFLGSFFVINEMVIKEKSTKVGPLESNTN